MPILAILFLLNLIPIIIEKTNKTIDIIDAGILKFNNDPNVTPLICVNENIIPKIAKINEL